MDMAFLLADRRARYMPEDRRGGMAMCRVDDLQLYATQTDVQMLVQVVVIIMNVPQVPISVPPYLL